MNPSRATIPLIRPHQCDSKGGRIRGVLLYDHGHDDVMRSYNDEGGREETSRKTEVEPWTECGSI